ncbi:unnamed protein product [Protopolystoma xenopodis]|uniref:Uncharacterized protein n=1 Tax=Protopolystoma xenopodis TaxID=117903 RepID=A0A3S5AGN9_9PLAT|nr:unnamed protein product [Protopolystoma xenopodis]
MMSASVSSANMLLFNLSRYVDSVNLFWLGHGAHLDLAIASFCPHDDASLRRSLTLDHTTRRCLRDAHKFGHDVDHSAGVQGDAGSSPRYSVASLHGVLCWHGNWDTVFRVLPAQQAVDDSTGLRRDE